MTPRWHFYFYHMLDTIKIIIPQNDYIITDYELFGATKSAVERCPAGYRSFINVYAKRKKPDIYYPKAAILKQDSRLNLTVEFSAPNVMFNNNINELNETDYEKVACNLSYKLAEMGIDVKNNILINADVLALHVSKNILLENSRPQEVIREICKADNPPRLDINKKSYTNNGESLQFHAASHSFVLYDKMADIAKSKIRSIDKFKPKLNLHMSPPPNILRLEARLIRRRKLSGVLAQLGYPIEPKFKDVFDTNLCKQALLLFWDSFVLSSLPPPVHDSPLETLHRIIIAGSPKPKRAVYLTGLATIIGGGGGISGLRSQLKERYSNYNWRHIKADINILRNILLTNNDECLAEVEEQLKKFQPIDLSKYYYDPGDQKRHFKDSAAHKEYKTLLPLVL